MFGYLIASASALTEAELKRYKACYCGLCRSLKERHGQLSRLTLNYDMAFLVILLESLYEPERESGSAVCLVHPKEKREYHKSEISDYAADINVALAYLKAQDDWRDDASIVAAVESSILKEAYNKIKNKYPRQCAAMEHSIFKLNSLETENSQDIDAAAASFGHLMGSVFVFKEDRWSNNLYSFGDSLGRFIYLMDACIDLDHDVFVNSYNPFRKYYGLDNKERFKEILKIFLADAIREYEMLPLIQDSGLMKNILCIGLWAKFENKFNKNKK